MLKLIAGFLAGILLTLGTLYLALPADVVRPVYSYIHHGQWWLHQESWSNAAYNYALGVSEEPSADRPPSFAKYQHTYLELVANQPLLKFSDTDLKKVCLSAITPGTLQSPPTTEGYVFLTPDARRRLGAVLLENPGVNVSFRFLGHELNTFIVDPEKVKHFIAEADNYTGQLGDPITDPDLSFEIPDSVMDTGAIMAAMLAGEKPLVPCHPSNSMDQLPGMKDGTSLYLQYLKMRDELLKEGLTVFGTKKAD